MDFLKALNKFFNQHSLGMTLKRIPLKYFAKKYLFKTNSQNFTRLVFNPSIKLMDFSSCSDEVLQCLHNFAN